jgi:chromosome segregation ATPase
MTDQMTDTSVPAPAGRGGPFFAILVLLALGGIIGAVVGFNKAASSSKMAASLRSQLAAREGKTIAPTEAMVPQTQVRERDAEIERLRKELEETRGKTGKTDTDRSALAEKLNGLERQVERLETDVLSRDRQIEELDSQVSRLKSAAESEKKEEKPSDAGGEKKPEEKKAEEKKPEAPKPGGE